MMLVDCDFHIHSKYSAATSKNMDLEHISNGALQKGLQVVATGDALNKHWLQEIEEIKFKNGIGVLGGCNFILSTEVEDKNRVHHLTLFKDLDSAYKMREDIEPHTPDLDRDGRPHVRLDGGEIASAAHRAGAMIGPSHAFVPWTSVYKEFDSIKECYGAERIDFLELGLSADTEAAQSIRELDGITFLSNSDAHSPLPNRLGREFNRLEIETISFDEIRKAILNLEGRRIVLNVGLDPRLGKYHRTSCIKCYTHLSLEEAHKNRWRCPKCRGIIKRGVIERISELEEPGFISERPRYLRIAPLAEIIANINGIKTVYSKKVQSIWKSLVEEFESEIAVLVDVPLDKISDIDGPTAHAIRMYREERFKIIEGGGGKYGEITFEFTGGDPIEDTASTGKKIIGQKSLDSY